ncbi:hypothetical protein SteCoe_12946 [Stentor coeruleus]|uniref:Uncharacterized protein n=1 Tax=Stentor coeruleus TaxID=5963 RepID=A0A1R2C9M8_9CILI|nr:hypothetical protein SteCoe_12946 [Stentor coeruleus]
MDYDKETLSLEVLHAESEKNSPDMQLKDSEICSWSNKIYPIHKNPDVILEISNIHDDKHNSSRDPLKSCSRTIRKHKILDQGNAYFNEFLSKSPKPRLDYNNLRKNKVEKKLAKSKKLISKHQKLDFTELSQSKIFIEIPQMLKYTNHLNSIQVKKFKRKNVQKDKPLASTRLNFYISPENGDKIIDILSKSRSPSPDTKKLPSSLANKLQMYTAKTLEELLANSKLPNIVSKKNQIKAKWHA